MLQRNQNRQLWVIGILIVTILVGVTIGNVAFARTAPGGTSFAIGWAGTRAFFADGTSPYSQTATSQIQTTVSWVRDPAEKAALRFVSPLYVIALYAPFALIQEYPVARGIWMTLLEACLAAIPLLTFRLVRKRASPLVTIAAIGLILGSYHTIQALLDGNTAILVTVLLLLLLTAIDRRQDEFAGILLALISFSPQNAFLLVLFVLIWALRKHRNALANWFLGTLALLVGFAVLLTPNWILQALQGSISVFGQLNNGSPGALMAMSWGSIGLRLSVFLSVIVAGILLREWFSALNGSETQFVWCVFITLALGQWIGIPTKPGNFVLLAPGILFSLMVLNTRWGNRGKTAIYIIVGVLTAFPWAIYGLLQGNAGLAALFILLPLITIGLLYWTKWWAVRSTQSG